MIEHDIVEPSNSTFINPLLVTFKKNGKIRPCLDARELNELLENDYAGPEPMDDVLAQCDGVKFISCLDLTMSFWQVPLKEWCRKFTAFKLFGRVLQFKVVPFGTTESGEL